MPTIAEFRQQHPEYHDMEDVELADALHQKFYSDIPKADFDKTLGIKTNQGLGFMEGVANVIDKIPDTPLDYIPGLDTRPLRKKNRADLQADFDRMEKTERPGGAGKFAGGFAASAPLLFMGGPAVSGALSGYATSEADTLGGKATDAVIGAVGGKVTAGALSHLGKTLAPALDPAVKRLKDIGVKLTPGMAKGGKAMVAEDKLMSRPIVGDAIQADRIATRDTLNRAGINRALKPLGVTLPDNIPTGHEAVDWMQTQVSNAYDSIMPKLSLVPDKRLAVGLRNATKVANVLPDSEADTFAKILKEKLDFGAAGQLTGRRLAVSLRDIRKAASGYSRSASEAERQLGEALSHVDDALHSALGSQNPGYAKALKATNLAYRGDRIMSDAAKGADEGIASTGQIKQSVKANDRSKNQRRTAAGTAHMQDFSKDARKVIPARTPDSGTAGRLQDGKLIPTMQGYGALAAYRTRQALLEAQAAAPPWVRKLGGALAHYSGVEGRIGGAAVANRPKER